MKHQYIETLLKDMPLNQLQDFKIAIEKNFMQIKKGEQITVDYYTNWFELYQEAVKYAHENVSVLTKTHGLTSNMTYGGIVLHLIRHYITNKSGSMPKSISDNKESSSHQPSDDGGDD